MGADSAFMFSLVHLYPFFKGIQAVDAYSKTGLIIESYDVLIICSDLLSKHHLLNPVHWFSVVVICFMCVIGLTTNGNS